MLSPAFTSAIIDTDYERTSLLERGVRECYNKQAAGCNQTTEESTRTIRLQKSQRILYFQQNPFSHDTLSFNFRESDPSEVYRWLRTTFLHIIVDSSRDFCSHPCNYGHFAGRWVNAWDSGLWGKVKC